MVGDGVFCKTAHLEKCAGPMVCILDPCRLWHIEIDLFIVDRGFNPVVAPFVRRRQSCLHNWKHWRGIAGVGDEGKTSHDTAGTLCI